ncbi:MAG: glycoside hydrolase family 172 protein [Armatimonadota bacterium]
MRLTHCLSGLLLFWAGAAAVCEASLLSDLAKPRDYTSHRLSSYATDGGNADGGQANPVKPGETRVIADLEGPGEIAHIWFTFAPMDKDVLTNVILRMYWDGEKEPSVESPVGAFFGLGHGKLYSFDSLPVSVVNDRGLNCFFPMPFNRNARVTLENQSDQTLQAVYYYVDYKRFREPRKDILYFHAQYRQEKPALGPENYLVFEARGKGHYVGQFYYIRSNSGGWWGEGDDVIHVDGRLLHGTGMEDYFGGAWGMKPGQSFARFGSPLFEVYMTGDGNENTAYRWHLEDAIAFERSIRFEHEHGSQNDRNDDFFSVAFWYQTHPRLPFPPLPSKFERLSFSDRKKALREQGRLEEYRALLRHFIEKAVEPEAIAAARKELEEAERLEPQRDTVEGEKQ